MRDERQSNQPRKCENAKRRLPPSNLSRSRASAVKNGRVFSFLEAVSIAEVEKDRAAIEQRSFTRAERAELSGKRAQTAAGFLALKRALVRLASSVSGDAPLCEKDFVLTHDKNGAPRCAAIPPACAGARISVSHTREWAYGLAAYQRPSPSSSQSSPAAFRARGRQ